MPHIDFETHGELYELADQVIVGPNGDDIIIKDPEVYMKRLSEVSAPRERLITFFKSQLSFGADSTHEAAAVRTMGATGLMIGWLMGGLYKCIGASKEFQRQHNASVFDGKYRRNRQFIDNYIYTGIRRGAKWGAGSFILCTSAGLIAYGSMTYRNKLYLPDWLICFSTLGAVSRCWLGLRGVVAGAGLGAIGGLIGYGLARGSEVFTGQSTSQLRYLNHVEYLKKREAKYNRIQQHRAVNDRQVVDNVISKS